MRKTIKSIDGKSEFFVEPFDNSKHDSIDDADSEVCNNIATGLPHDWETLDWHVMEEYPCRMGCDVYFAVRGDRAWFIFDQFANALTNVDLDLEAFADVLANDPGKLDDYR